MAELIVRTPGQPERALPLADKAVVVGRAEGCDVQVMEARASKKHLALSPHVHLDGSRGWVVTDLQSSNGTFVGSERILRRALSPGDVVRIGETTLEIRDAGAPAAGPAAPKPVVSGKLLIQKVEPGAAAALPGSLPAPEPVEEAAPEEAALSPEEEARIAQEEAARQAASEEKRARRAGQRSLMRAAAFAAVAAVAVVAVEYVVGGVADGRLARQAENDAYLEVLAKADRNDLAQEVTRFEKAFPRSRHVYDLKRLVEARKGVDRIRGSADEDIDTAQSGIGTLFDSEVLGRLAELKWRVQGDDRLSRRVDLAFQQARARRAETIAREWRTVDREVEQALSRKEPTEALRRLFAFRASHVGLPSDTADRLATREKAARAAATAVADEAIAWAKAEKEPERQRRLLLDAMRSVASTDEVERLSLALREVTGGAVPSGTESRPGSTPGIPTAPTAPTVAPSLLARAAEAERLAHERKWAHAARAYAQLAEADAAPRIKKEWADRNVELSRVVSLVKDLADAVAAAGDRPVRLKLEGLENGGVFDVLTADVDQVRLKRGDRERTEAWAALSAGDVVTLLSPRKPTPDQRLAVATLAAEVEDRKAAVEALLPLVDLDSHRDAAFLLVARRLYGRTDVPSGGYRVFDGDLVDTTEYARRVEAKQIAALEAEATTIVGKIAADPVFKKIEALRAKRDELDKRRAYALLAIFNEKHWPYPHPDSIMTQYELVWSEIVKRTKAVEEIWNDVKNVSVSKSGGLDKLFERHAVIVKDLSGRRRDVRKLKEAIKPYALYAGEKELNIRTFYRDVEERERLAYSRWVMEVYNPAQTAYASGPERDQTRITNEYRVMMGFSMQVKAGDAAIEAIAPETVVKILDAAVEENRRWIVAVKIDDRLVKAARDHSIDMVKHGYFAHVAPANSDMPGSSPFERMAKAGYSGMGASENIAMAGGPLDAHQRWLWSSGHHRNILSDWSDQGVGVAGKDWTQNFGTGGGGPREIPGRKPPEEEPDDEPPAVDDTGGGGDGG